MLRTCFIFLLIYCLHTPVSAQTRTIEQLKKEAEVAITPGLKLQAVFALCEQRQSLHTDTLCRYATLAKELSMRQDQVPQQALADYYLAGCLVKRGLLDSAYNVCERTLSNTKRLPEAVDARMKLTGLKGQILTRESRYKESLAEFYKVLNIAEEQNDVLMQMAAKNGIGWVNMEMDQPREALNWFFRALKTTDKKLLHERNSNIYSNIAAVYKQLERNDSAEYYIKIAIDFSRRIENLFFLANSLNIQADISIAADKEAQAEAPLKEALAIRKQIGDAFYIISDMSQLAVYYASIGDTAKGLALSREGIMMAKDLGITSKLPFLYYALGENYKAAGDHLAYGKTLEKIMALKDSMYAATSAEEKMEMETRYHLGEKENLILRQKLQIANKNYLIYGSVLLLILTAVVAGLFFTGYKKNQQIKLLKMQAEQKQAEALAVRSAEENERKRISRDLHDNIGAYATVLMANTEQLKKQTSSPDFQQTLKSIAENAGHIIGSLRETIWVLNNDLIKVTDFFDRFKLYARKMTESYPDVNMLFEEIIIADINLSPVEAFNVFRIMQEALQNILKHSGSKNISVTVSSDKNFMVTIIDDGKGFVPREASLGNGLYNMQHRAKEAGYTFTIDSAPGKTAVIIKKNNL